MHASTPCELCGFMTARPWPALQSRAPPMLSSPSTTRKRCIFRHGAWIGRARRWASNSAAFVVTNRFLIKCFEPALPSRLRYIDDKLDGGCRKCCANGQRRAGPGRIFRRSGSRRVLLRSADDHGGLSASYEQKDRPPKLQ